MLTCLLTLIITYSYVHLLWCSRFSMFTCLDDRLLLCLLMIAYPLACMPSTLYAWTFWWLPTPMLKCFNDYMLTCIDIHMFEIHTHVHTCGSWNVYWLGGISDCVVGRTCTQMLKWLCLNVENIGILEECILRWLNAHMLVCSHDHMLVCSYG